MPRENQESLQYSIQWLSPNLSKVRIRDSESTLLKTVWISEEEITIADHVNDKAYKGRSPVQVDDPMIQPIAGYLTPTELVEQMYGQWKFQKTEQTGECDQGISTFSLTNERAQLEVKIDLCTFLPVSIEKMLSDEGQAEKKPIMSVQCKWNISISPEDLLPKPIQEK
jgi:hypothetical protein